MNTISEKVLQIACSDIVADLQWQFPNWSQTQCNQVAKQILQGIDWDDWGQMHKGLKWLTRRWCRRNIPGFTYKHQCRYLPDVAI